MPRAMAGEVWPWRRPAASPPMPASARATAVVEKAAGAAEVGVENARG